MLRPLLSELSIQVEIEAKSNLLIKDGRYTQKTKADWCDETEDPKKSREKAPDFIFVSRSEISDLKRLALDPAARMNTLDYYVPGASVRGAWRSHLEKVLRSLDATPKICDPMATDKSDKGRPDRSCSTRLVNEDEKPPEHAYKDSCPVCKLFGSTAHASRLWFSDGSRVGTSKAVMVDNVAISRQTGSVISPFKSVVLQQAKFSLEMRLRNFELWQVGLLGHLFDDLAAKRVPLGSGKNKGFGQVGARAAGMTVAYYGRTPGGKLCGLCELVNATGKAAHYGLAQEEAVDLAGICQDGDTSLWRVELVITNPAEFWGRAKPKFSRVVWDRFEGLRLQAAGA